MRDPSLFARCLCTGLLQPSKRTHTIAVLVPTTSCLSFSWVPSTHSCHNTSEVDPVNKTKNPPKLTLRPAVTGPRPRSRSAVFPHAVQKPMLLLKKHVAIVGLVWHWASRRKGERGARAAEVTKDSSAWLTTLWSDQMCNTTNCQK